MPHAHLGIPNFEFNPQEIARTVRKGGLLSMEIEFSLRCNFRCPYCYVPEKSCPDDELTRKELKSVISQARALGARKIIILGGEPSIYPHLLEMVTYIDALGLEIELFTNGTGITTKLARFLYKRHVRVVVKMNSFNAERQDRLSGVKGAYQTIQTALARLKAAGYPSGNFLLAVSTIMCRDNLEELIPLWIWLRDQEILPYFEIITPQENANLNKWLMLDPSALHKVFKYLAAIDRQRYGQVWTPQPPLVGNRCLRHKFSCLVTSRGEVMPCVGVTLSMGNIRKTPLGQILKESRILSDLKNHRATIKGPCADCENAETCYGCRGAAFQMTGDYLASDPLCWKNCGHL